MAIYARSKNLARIVERIERTKDTVFSAEDVNATAKIPLVFGYNTFKPSLVDAFVPHWGGSANWFRSPNYPPSRDRRVPAEIGSWGVYLLSYNESPSTVSNPNDDYLGQMYFGEYSGILPGGRTDRDYLNRSARGETYFAFGPHGRDTRRVGAAQYIKAGTYFTDALNDFKQDYPGFFNDYFDQLFNLLARFDCLLVLIGNNATSDPTGGSLTTIPDIAVSYQREAKTPGATHTNVGSNVGNCLRELVTNPDWGLGISDSSLEETDFTSTSIEINTVLDMSQPIIEHVNSLADVDFGSVTRIDSKIRYISGSSNVVDFTINADTILDTVEIIYPDTNQQPTKLIADYYSLYGETKSVEIGSSNANIKKVKIKHLGKYPLVEEYLSFLFAKLTESKEYKWRMDKTAQQISVGDIVRLNADYPDLNNEDVRITNVSLRDDYSFDVEGVSAILPRGTVILTGARRILPVGDGQIVRIPRDDSRGPEPEPIVPPPLPGEIGPPPEIKTVLDLQHPYNLVSRSENTDWYLGALVDDETPDPNYDINGIQTTGWSTIQNRTNARGFAYLNEASLIWARPDKKPPDFIFYATDVFLDDARERKEKYVGKSFGNAQKSNRFYFPGFFTNNPSPSYRYWRSDWTQSGMITWSRYENNILLPDKFGFPNVYKMGQTSDADDVVRTFEPEQRQVNGINVINYPSPSTAINIASRVNGVYRMHFSAAYGEIGAPNRVEYIGTTTFYGDGRGVLPQFESSAKRYFLQAGGNWLYNYTIPPTRDKRP